MGDARRLLLEEPRLRRRSSRTTRTSRPSPRARPSRSPHDDTASALDGLDRRAKIAAKPCVVEEVSTMSVKVRPYRGDTTGKQWEVDIRFEWPDGDVFRERKHTPCNTEAAALRWGEAREREMFKK